MTDLSATRDALRAITTHVMVRAMQPSTDRISLRPAPGGWATPTFGAERRRLRIANGVLFDERDGNDGARVRAIGISGATMGELAAFAEVDLADVVWVGDDTPPLGDVAAPIELDPAAMAMMADCYDVTARALDRLVVEWPAWASPSVPQLWPEHFDLAIDIAVAADIGAGDAASRRANVGGSPGDGYHDGPYLYVGPWTSDRPGDPTYWNAPFGAVLAVDALGSTGSPDERAEVAAAFFVRGLRLLAAG
jgi:hypothetical protein